MASSRMKVGITGGIGAGKSLICEILKVLGVPVYDADGRARELMNRDLSIREEVIKTFGTEAYSESELNRKWLAEQVFADKQRLGALNRIVHPHVRSDYEVWVSKQDFHYSVKEAALLIESGSYSELDRIILVTAPEELKIQRVLKRDPQRTRQQVEEIMGQQLTDSDKVLKSDFVIDNDETQFVIPQVLEVHTELLG